jgi:hypothetical protein
VLWHHRRFSEMTSASDTRPSRLGRVLGSLWSKLIAPLIVLVAAFYVGVTWAHHEARPTQTERILFHPNGYEFPSSLHVIRHTSGTRFANLSIRFNYRCGKGQALGIPSRRGKLWTIMYLARESAETQPVQIAKIW